MKGVYATQFTGGTTDALDYADGATLEEGCPGIVCNGGVDHKYVLDASSGATADGLTVIAPVTNAGAKRWLLQIPYGVDLNATKIRQVLPISSVATYTITSTSVTSLSDSMSLTPLSETSNFFVFAVASVVVKSTASGNDARGTYYLSFYDGSAYQDVFGRAQGLSNVTPYGTGDVDLMYGQVAFSCNYDQSSLRSDTGVLMLRLRGKCDYANNEIDALNIYGFVVEYEP